MYIYLCHDKMESNSCCCCYDQRNHLIMMTVISIETTVKKMQGMKLKKNLCRKYKKKYKIKISMNQ